ncbi:MAG: hypothetical protein PVG32_21030 [Anaerolineales bacterium]|jgi:hypothetical protein
METQPKTEIRNYTTVFIIIILLLLVLVATQGYSVYSTYQQTQLAEERAKTYQDRAEEALDVAQTQRNLVVGLLNDYEKAAYDNPDLERISEQQLIATEFMIRALQIIAIQNSQIIELLAQAP